MRRLSAREHLSMIMSSVMRERLEKAVDKYGDTATPAFLPIPNSVEGVCNALREVGNPLIVGGTVRDCLMGIEPKDFDIEVHGASVESISSVLKGYSYRVDAVGQAFGVLKVRANNEEMDISVPRRDSLIGVGHRGFSVETDPHMGIVEASKRRDYTINSIMYDPHLKVILDPHSGVKDIEALILRHVSDAFADDPLRPLRGMQFAARYNMTLHPETAELSSTLRERYQELAQERVRDEWMKFYIKGTHPSAGLKALQESGWETTITGYHLIDHNAVDKVAEAPLTLKAAVMARNMDNRNARAFLKETIVGKKNVANAYALSRTAPPSEISTYSMRQWSRQLATKGLSIQDWAYREEAYDIDTQGVMTLAGEAGVIYSPREDLITGDDIIFVHPQRKAGRWVGELLVKAQQAYDADEYETYTDAIIWLQSVGQD